MTQVLTSRQELCFTILSNLALLAPRAAHIFGDSLLILQLVSATLETSADAPALCQVSLSYSLAEISTTLWQISATLWKYLLFPFY